MPFSRSRISILGSGRVAGSLAMALREVSLWGRNTVATSNLAEKHGCNHAPSLAEALKAQKKMAEAIIQCNKAIHYEPASAQLYCLRAKIYQEAGELDKATADFNKAAELDPKGPAGKTAQQQLKQIQKR